jgi:hypothetical protein
MTRARVGISVRETWLRTLENQDPSVTQEDLLRATATLLSFVLHAGVIVDESDYMTIKALIEQTGF